MQTRIEKDLLGELQVPANAYYGIQTLRAIDNFNISTDRLEHYRTFIWALGAVKMSAAKANQELGLLENTVANAIITASQEVMDGKFDKEFPIDMIQGGAGTSTNMNANEVIANRALELMGYKKGEYQYCSPNDLVNMSQSTNDAYPTAGKLAIAKKHFELIEHLKALVNSFRNKAVEFQNIIKMGRTQLQDAVPMTLGQEFNAFATNLENEIDFLNYTAMAFFEVNMGGTAIGTGLNAAPGYSDACAKYMCDISGYPICLAVDLVQSTPDTGAFVKYSAALKALSIKLSKTCNDLRLLSSGPRAGFSDINLPAVQPGSSIMPGKVNPVIPEVVNQICFKVIGNDTTVSMASEAAQLQLNVMEPIIIHSIMNSMHFLQQGFDILREKCIDGITANNTHTESIVRNSIGIVTALNPYIGYKKGSEIAKKALETGKSVYDLVLLEGILSKEKLDEILSPVNMVGIK